MMQIINANGVSYDTLVHTAFNSAQEVDTIVVM